MKKFTLSLLAVSVLWFLFLKNDTVKLGPGVFAPDSPIQERIDSPENFYFHDYTITPLAKFDIEAKVLSKKNYLMGREAELSPVDLALGWGRMSDEKVLDSLDISQSNRWYFWQTDALPIPRREIETHSGNMHLIPADKSVESMINSARTGDIVEFGGALVRVDAQDGWYWVSSLSREDIGAHSCEVVWVESFWVKEIR